MLYTFRNALIVFSLRKRPMRVFHTSNGSPNVAASAIWSNDPFLTSVNDFFPEGAIPRQLLFPRSSQLTNGERTHTWISYKSSDGVFQPDGGYSDRIDLFAQLQLNKLAIKTARDLSKYCFPENQRVPKQKAVGDGTSCSSYNNGKFGVVMHVGLIIVDRLYVTYSLSTIPQSTKICIMKRKDPYLCGRNFIRRFIEA